MQTRMSPQNELTLAHQDSRITQFNNDGRSLTSDTRNSHSVQRHIQSLANTSHTSTQLKTLQTKMQGKADIAQRLEEEEPLQGEFDTAQRVEEEEALQGKFETTQRKEQAKPNNTGLPNQLKSGIESMSGMSMDHVKVHYNSDKPAQLNAHAYAQGSEIHVAPGQEKHLPHEAWHVVQQAQGRVKPTMQMKGDVQVNDDVSLETEADVMGTSAIAHVLEGATPSKNLQLKKSDAMTSRLVRVQGEVAQLAQWKMSEDDHGISYWDESMDGVIWFSNGVHLWFRISGATSEDYRALEGVKKTWAEWHGLRRIAHPEEYSEDRPDYAGSLMERYEARYLTDIKWAERSGVDESLGKTIVIDTSVKKSGGGAEPVYQNSYNVLTDVFSADWNQKKKDDEVGVTTSTALPNSDLLTCHRELARKFAASQGVMPKSDSGGFQVVRHNINNDEWQNKIFPQLSINIRGSLSGGLTVTRDDPCRFIKPVVLGDKSASSMWEVFEKLIPNTKAVFFMVSQRYNGFGIASWRFQNGSAIATIKPLV